MAVQEHRPVFDYVVLSTAYTAYLLSMISSATIFLKGNVHDRNSRSRAGCWRCKPKPKMTLCLFRTASFRSHQRKFVCLGIGIQQQLRTQSPDPISAPSLLPILLRSHRTADQHQVHQLLPSQSHNAIQNVHSSLGIR